MIMIGAAVLIFLMLHSWRFAAAVGIVVVGTVLIFAWMFHVDDVRREEARAAARTEQARYDTLPRCPPPPPGVNPFDQYVDGSFEKRKATCRD